MKKITYLLLSLLIMLLVAGCSPTSPTTTTDPKQPEKTSSSEVDSVKAFVDKHLTSEKSQQWGDVYDTLHPDIQSKYPKDQFIVEYKSSNFAKHAESVKDHKIDGVVMLDTWTDTKGTGAEYKDVAEVSYTENLKDGKSDKGSMHVAKAPDGTWRWFCTPPKQNSPGKNHFAIGDAFKLGDLQYKVNSIRLSNGNTVMKPKDGNTFLLIDMTVENQGDKDAPISSMMSFKLVDKDGRSQEYSIGAMTEGKGQMDATLAPGRKVSGELGYEALKGSQTFELEITSSPINGKVGIVEIPVK